MSDDTGVDPVGGDAPDRVTTTVATVPEEKARISVAEPVLATGNGPALLFSPTGEPIAGGSSRRGMLPEDPAVMAAILAAAEACWPRAGEAAAACSGRKAPSWRFSGRWWRTVAQARRERPWVDSERR